jgi:GTP-binding protein HflX
VGIKENFEEDFHFNISLEELKSLANTAGAEIIHTLTQKKKKINPATLIGKGKLFQLKEIVEKLKADLVIFNKDLTGVQLRNIEDWVKVKVIDRTELILDIFASHARTKEARMQVELAQASYLLPRLTGKGVWLSRLGGGIGTRGPGETKLEIDRRRINDKIIHLKKAIIELASQRERERKIRRDMIMAAIVGYTNVGKSTLLNVLTKSRVKVGDQLFVTLDPKIRRLDLNKNMSILLADTVGFIQNLPPHLIASFKATLEEVKEADIILHVADLSSPYLDIQIDSVEEILKEIEAFDKPIFLIYNKVDKLNNEKKLKKLKNRRDSIVISALRGEHIEELKERLSQFILKSYREIEIIIPEEKERLKRLIKNRGYIESFHHLNGKIYFKVKLPKELAIELQRKYGVD